MAWIDNKVIATYRSSLGFKQDLLRELQLDEAAISTYIAEELKRGSFTLLGARMALYSFGRAARLPPPSSASLLDATTTTLTKPLLR